MLVILNPRLYGTDKECTLLCIHMTMQRVFYVCCQVIFRNARGLWLWSFDTICIQRRLSQDNTAKFKKYVFLNTSLFNRILKF